MGSFSECEETHELLEELQVIQPDHIRYLKSERFSDHTLIIMRLHIHEECPEEVDPQYSDDPDITMPPSRVAEMCARKSTCKKMVTLAQGACRNVVDLQQAINKAKSRLHRLQAICPIGYIQTPSVCKLIEDVESLIDDLKSQSLGVDEVINADSSLGQVTQVNRRPLNILCTVHFTDPPMSQ